MCVLSLLFSSVSSAFSSLPPLLSPQLLPLLFFSFLLPLSLSTLSLLPLILLFLCFLIHFFRLFCLLSFLFFFCLCRFYRFFHLFSPLFLPLLSSLPLLSLFAPFAPFPSSAFWLFLLLSPLSFSSVQKPGQFCLLLVFIPADVSTFYLFCPKARSILGCLSQPPD